MNIAIFASGNGTNFPAIADSIREVKLKANLKYKGNNNLTPINYSLCNNNGKCAEVCPTKTIAKKEKGEGVS